ncbi:MAG: hypothetical protein LGR52_06650, partial [Candidatus Thiosymbion ectosymbiont of Robbea hypermnestra]|nr:hypothetical protein [Candidatus Thiosymbion ectosymbiont of Robbea hypermnestra]
MSIADPGFRRLSDATSAVCRGAASVASGCPRGVSVAGFGLIASDCDVAVSACPPGRDSPASGSAGGSDGAGGPGAGCGETAAGAAAA